uniref:protein-tyrosine-phosphatase n=1 Tax=Varanus komodoensis TaxID=61221 RepID=A0A8D2JER5_VARKO
MKAMVCLGETTIRSAVACCWLFEDYFLLKQEHVIAHFQYMAWPDRGIPDTYGHFLDMIEYVRCKQGEDTVPICVHCSAGCGRTGVICTLDYIRQLLLKQRIPPHFNIFDIVLQMRKQRPAAVQTQEQYQFVYHAVTEMFWAALNFSNKKYENIKEVRKRLRDESVSEPTPSALPDLPPKLTRNMGDTYAVVNKFRQSKAGASPTSEAKPDSEPPQYAAVKPWNSSMLDPAAIDPTAFVGLQASHSLPGSPVRRLSPSTALESPSPFLPTLYIGFNFRIGKPKGPRDPPAEWSRE